MTTVRPRFSVGKRFWQKHHRRSAGKRKAVAEFIWGNRAVLTISKIRTQTNNIVHMDSLKAAATSSLQVWKLETVRNSHLHLIDRQQIRSFRRSRRPQQNPLRLLRAETNTQVVCTRARAHSQTHTYKLARNSTARSQLPREPALPGYVW